MMLKMCVLDRADLLRTCRLPYVVLPSMRTISSLDASSEGTRISLNVRKLRQPLQTILTTNSPVVLPTPRLQRQTYAFPNLSIMTIYPVLLPIITVNEAFPACFLTSPLRLILPPSKNTLTRERESIGFMVDSQRSPAPVLASPPNVGPVSVTFDEDQATGVKKRPGEPFAGRRRKLSESNPASRVQAGRYQRKLALFEDGEIPVIDGPIRSDGPNVKTPLLSDAKGRRMPSFGATGRTSVLTEAGR